MFQLRAVFPYGLNNVLADDFVKEGTQVLLGSKFPP